jgi:predicted dehydrogenase
MTIAGRHQIDALCHCLGEFREVSAYAVNQRGEIFAEDKGTTIPLTSPDQLAVIGLLESGAVVSFQIRGGMARGIEFLFEIHGSEGDLVAAATIGGSHPQASGLPLHPPRQSAGSDWPALINMPRIEHISAPASFR